MKRIMNVINVLSFTKCTAVQLAEIKCSEINMIRCINKSTGPGHLCKGSRASLTKGTESAKDAIHVSARGEPMCL